jgi:(1->4)-alpha-D-glucan 1-alpha-D-glucosylmutase
METQSENLPRPRVPVATYRLQFNSQFTFADATTLVEYLNDLGISDVYSSPLLKARAGSMHGYDITDHSRLNPELGGREQFNRFTDKLRQHGMGLVMDVVPNHMCIAGNENEWWRDVLENGPGSPYAGFLDIDWHPLKESLVGRVLLPVLGDQFGRVLEDGQIKLEYRRGTFTANVYEMKLPIAPRTTLPILEEVRNLVGTQLGDASSHLLELESIITSLTHLPSRMEVEPERVKERRREKEVVRRRLSALSSSNKVIRRAIEQVMAEYNGARGNAASFNRLEELLGVQPYRLCYWRVAADEINYRRFFDVNELAAIRVEEPKVFAAVHDLIFRLVREGRVTGLRIDHIDGLWEPVKYLRDLQRHARKALTRGLPPLAGGETTPPRNRRYAAQSRPMYVVVEKILAAEERLHDDWAAHGTTGYDFMNLLGGVFVETRSGAMFNNLYQRFTGVRPDFEEHYYTCKKLILEVAMSSELSVLARRLERIAEQHRYSRDFTLRSLETALGELIACFPVYRSYLNEQNVIGEDDRRHIHAAISAAKRLNPAVSASIYDFLRSLLLQEDPEGISKEQRAERRQFVMRLQQLTGPVTAKGVEDTAFYRCFPLASLCEVGGEPSRFGVTLEQFHVQNARRAVHWPHAMLATSTHDTKRSEDVRARINVLSEIPRRWYRAVRRWQQINAKHKSAASGITAPFNNEEYLLYQTLVGTWPFEAFTEESKPRYTQRIQQYLVKALREAKIHSSWVNPNEEYEQAACEYLARILSDEEFLAEFIEFWRPVARAGMWNSLSQVLLKITAPGLPDFYQGTETWGFSLVDPDNRQPVDYGARRRLLADLRGVNVDELMRTAEDGRIKLYLNERALKFRRDHRTLFEQGSYQALFAEGERAEQVISFVRSVPQAGDQTNRQAVIVVATRFFSRFEANAALPVGREAWGDTVIPLDKDLAGCYREVLTGANVCAEMTGDGAQLRLAELLAQLPVALLTRTT